MQGKSSLTHCVKKHGNTPYKKKRKEKNEKESCGIIYKRNQVSERYMELNNRMTYEHKRKCSRKRKGSVVKTKTHEDHSH